MNTSHRITILALLCLALGATTAFGESSARFDRIAPYGTATEIQLGTAVGEGPPAEARGEYLWRSVREIIIGSSTGISRFEGHTDVMVGHEQNPPTPVEMFDADGDGTPYWTYDVSLAQVAAREGAYVLADYIEGRGIDLFGWLGDFTAPAWSMSLSGCLPAGYSNTLKVSMDGSRVAFGCFHNNKVRFLAIETATGAVLVDTYIVLDAASIRGLDLTDDGHYVDLNCGVTHVVYDVDANTERARVDTGASTRPVAISETGEWIVAGFTSTKAYQWDDHQQTYVQRWSITGNRYAGAMMVSEQGYWIVGWYSSDYDQNRIVRYNLDDGSVAWTTVLPSSSGEVQDLPVGCDFSADRQTVGFAFWGDLTLRAPELAAFDAGDGSELVSVQAPGSMFDVSISSGGHYISGTGKLVHANIMGNGSDTYCALARELSSVPIAPTGGLRVDAAPNPFTGATTLFARGLDQATSLRILDPSGREIRTLRPTGDALQWDGRNAVGDRVPAGTYFCVPVGSQGEATRLVVLR